MKSRGPLHQLAPAAQTARMPHREVPREHLRFARALRGDMTSTEGLLWWGLHDLHGFRFRRQVPFGPFVLDFFCPKARLVVEVDGDSHEETRDENRDAWLAARGLRVMRFSNHEVFHELDEVLGTIWRELVGDEG